MTTIRTVLIILLSVSAPGMIPAQSLTDIPAKNERAAAPKIPEYLVYRHFLGWVGALDRKASLARESDPYKFAAPFSRAQLKNADLDVLRSQAKSLDYDLRKLDTEANKVIADFREKAKRAAQSGQSLPPVPPELGQMQAKRTAIIVQHVITLKTSLGSQRAAGLDTYLGREFVPHVSLKALGKTPSDASKGSEPQTFVSEGQ